jgi:hypothetical protein
MHSHQRLLLSFGLGLLCLAIYSWELKVSNVLSFYDSGTYLASSINLVNGILPYRDFTFVQPPGIALILSPIAFLGKFIGSHDAFFVARVLSAFVSAANVALLAWLLRARGRVAMIIGGLGLGLLPIGTYETAGIKLEPYCLIFILLGAIVLLSEQESGQPISRRRLIIGGLFFGVAALVKIFAFLPFIGMVIALYPGNRRRVVNFILAAGVGFTVFVLPFFIASPRGFTSQVFVQQLLRKSSSSETLSVIQRFIAMVGLSGTWLSTHGTVVILTLAGAAVFVAVAYLRPPLLSPLDSFFLWASVFTSLGLLMAAQFINYYGYFSEPFLLGLCGIALNRTSSTARTQIGHLPIRPKVRRLISVISAATLTLLVIAFTLYTTTSYSNRTRVLGFHVAAVAPITQLIPEGSCVVYDNIALAVAADRWPGRLRHCPHVIDPYGMWLAWGYHLIPAAPAFTQEWKSYFEQAQYVVLGSPESSFIPWNHGLRKWFISHFHLLHDKYPAYIYQKD